MPEIWLPYGSVEVALDIKVENLSEIFQSKISKLDEEELNEKVRTYEIREKSLIILGDVSQATIKILNSILNVQKDKGIEIDDFLITVQEKYVKNIKKVLEEKNLKTVPFENATEQIGNCDGFSIKIPKNFLERPRLLISQIGFDPLFGFKGGPASLIKAVDIDLMAEAFQRRIDDNPKPGIETDSLKFAVNASEVMGEFTSLEILNKEGEISELFFGDLKKAHDAASKKFFEESRQIINKPISSLICSKADPFTNSTFSSVINSIWNVVGGLEKNGMLAILTESSEGLGSKAFEYYAMDRFNFDEMIEKRIYIEGLEDLLFFKKCLKEFNVIVTTTLPQYYIKEKLGLNVAKKTSEILDKIIEEKGKKNKITIIPDISNILLNLE